MFLPISMRPLVSGCNIVNRQRLLSTATWSSSLPISSPLLPGHYKEYNGHVVNVIDTASDRNTDADEEIVFCRTTNKSNRAFVYPLKLFTGHVE